MKRLSMVLLALTMYFSVIVSYAEDSTYVNYEVKLKTYGIGNYKVAIEAHEIPSQELLPIISNQYFMIGNTQDTAVVDNNPPSAVYHQQQVQKVDVVIATGKLDQMETLLDENTTKAFQAALSAAGNNFDMKLWSVETVTSGFDMRDVDARTIFNEWEQYPFPNSFELTPDGKYLKNHGGTLKGANGYGIQLDGVMYDSNNAGGFNQAFIDPESEGSQEVELSAWISPHPTCGCGGGFVVKWDKESDESYFVALGELERGNLAIYKMHNTSKYWGGEWDNVIGVMTLGDIHCHGATGEPVAKASGLGRTAYYTVTVDNNGTIKVYRDTSKRPDIKVDTPVLEWTDPQPIEAGFCGLFATCTIGITDVMFKYKMLDVKSLGEAVSDVAWRDNSIRFVVYATDIKPMEFDEENETHESDYIYTVTKLMNANCFLVNLGTTTGKYIDNEWEPPNKVWLDKFVAAIRDESVKDLNGNIIDKGTFFENSNILSKLTGNTTSYIKNIAERLSKPSDWVLVNTEVLWNTEYKDHSVNAGTIEGEFDLPMNFGEHDGNARYLSTIHSQPQDKSDADNLITKWKYTNAMTHLYESMYITTNGEKAKINAERWRYRHFYDFFDNSFTQVGYHNSWMDDPVSVFEYPGKYRINYKRLDNPFYPNVDLNYEFNEFRQWSTNYDYRNSTLGGGGNG